MIARIAIALKYHSDKCGRGTPCPCFSPDFSSDNELYKEIGGLNEVSIAQSDSSLRNICSVRLQQIRSPTSISADDSVLMENIIPKSLETNELLNIAHGLESDVLADLNKKQDE